MVLAMALVFLAFLNAAGMIRPMEDVRAAVAGGLGTGSEVVVWSVIMLVGLGVAPVALLGAAGWLSRRLAGDDGLSARRIVLRMAYGLVPVGFGMWLAHYAFHFLASGLNLIPVLHRGAIDIGLAAGPPSWDLAAMIPGDWLLPLELIVLEASALGSLVLLHYIAKHTFGSARSAVRGMIPWAVLTVGLAGAGAWIMTQPMAMRGMMMPGMDMPGIELDAGMPGMDAMEMDTPGMDHDPGSGLPASPDGTPSREEIDHEEHGTMMKADTETAGG